ncbi:MAG: carboxylesterase family protein, partial [Lachnospiraceae bacterium]|nr:carboxylesterase family protein [Lachnospiraceae bacterium]
EEVISLSGATSFDEFKEFDEKTVLGAVEEIKKVRKDNTVNTQPVIDGYLLTDSVDKLIGNPLKLDYMAGTTSNDMYNVVLYNMARKFIGKNDGYRYYFDIDAPGDDNGAFHSSDLRYLFGTLKKSFRPYDSKDEEISDLMMDYISDFVKTGDPNALGRPVWKRGWKCLFISKKGVGMKRPNPIKLIVNTFRGDPK